jgi:hypothetical protein
MPCNASTYEHHQAVFCAGVLSLLVALVDLDILHLLPCIVFLSPAVALLFLANLNELSYH